MVSHNQFLPKRNRSGIYGKCILRNRKWISQNRKWSRPNRKLQSKTFRSENYSHWESFKAFLVDCREPLVQIVNQNPDHSIPSPKMWIQYSLVNYHLWWSELAKLARKPSFIGHKSPVKYKVWFKGTQNGLTDLKWPVQNTKRCFSW